MSAPADDGDCRRMRLRHRTRARRRSCFAQRPCVGTRYCAVCDAGRDCLRVAAACRRGQGLGGNACRCRSHRGRVCLAHVASRRCRTCVLVRYARLRLAPVLRLTRRDHASGYQRCTDRWLVSSAAHDARRSGARLHRVERARWIRRTRRRHDFTRQACRSHGAERRPLPRCRPRVAARSRGRDRVARS